MFANRLVRSLKVKPSVALARSMGGGGHHGPMMPPFIRIRPPSSTVCCSFFSGVFSRWFHLQLDVLLLVLVDSRTSRVGMGRFGCS